MSDEMSAEEMARLFGEEVPKGIAPVDAPDLYKDNGIYQIAGRIKNHVAFAGFPMSPNALMICNTYAHMMFAFYQFGLTLGEEQRAKLDLLIRKQEEGAAGLIAAGYRNVKHEDE